MRGGRPRVLFIALVATTLAVAACENQPAAPSKIPSARIPGGTDDAPWLSTPGVALELTDSRGLIFDTAGGPIMGALIVATTGAQAGYSMTSDARGEFTIPSSFDDRVVFRATSNGYVPASSRLSRLGPTASRSLTFFLDLIAPPLDLAGTFTFTVVADASCTQLPSQAQSRSYTATITSVSDPAHPRTLFNLRTSGATYFEDTVNISVAGNYARFFDAGDWQPVLSEALEDGATFEYVGEASAQLAGTSVIAATLVGTITYRTGQDTASCTSKNHRLILTRR